jgi:two-component system sensor histidine kinase CpxA
MAKLVEEVLSFTKAAHLAEQSEPEDIDLPALISNVVAREASDVEVNVSVPDLHMHTLHEALDRSISNIVRNAVRYASRGGSIDISARALDAGTVEITIRDHGPGVPAEALGKIFDAFFRLDPARGRHTGGAGLGLAIVRRCVDACRGKVSASLADPGLMFTITLPTS